MCNQSSSFTALLSLEKVAMEPSQSMFIPFAHSSDCFKKTRFPSQCSPHLPTLLTVSRKTCFACLSTFNEGNPTTYMLLCLVSFAQQMDFVYLYSGFVVSEESSIIDTLYSVFSHSPVDWHLGHFPVLAILNEAALNIHVQVILWMYASFPVRKCLGAELLGHNVSVCLFF